MLVGLAPLGAVAQSAAESLGQRPCTELVAAQTEDEALYAGFGAWIGGFLSAASAYEPDTFDLTPWQPIEYATAQVTAACTSRVDMTVAQATAGYVQYLRPHRLRTPSALVRVQADARAIFVYREVLDQIRAALLAQGASITDPDGTYGPTSGRAMVDFQQRAGLAVTGLPDTQTLIRLLE